MQYIDLHTHSQASDGTDTPSCLVRKAHEAGLAAVALTDHDTLSGLAEAQAAGRELGIQVVRGCEISTATEHGEIHILGLWIPENARSLLQVLADLRAKRARRNVGIVKKLQDLGCDICMEEVQAVAKDSVGRPHIAEVLYRKGYVQSVRQAFDVYLGYGGKAYLPKEVLSPGEAVRLLADMGATVSLAHPLIHHYPAEWMDAFVKQLVDCGLMAIEAWHSSHTEADVRRCVAWAQAYDLGLSGGSDYHGEHKPGIRLGVGIGNLRIPLHVLEKLEERRHALGLAC